MPNLASPRRTRLTRPAHRARRILLDRSASGARAASGEPADMMPRVVTAMPVAPATPRGMVRGDNAHDGVSDRGAGRPSAHDGHRLPEPRLRVLGEPRAV